MSLFPDNKIDLVRDSAILARAETGDVIEWMAKTSEAMDFNKKQDDFYKRVGLFLHFQEQNLKTTRSSFAQSMTKIHKLHTKTNELEAKTKELYANNMALEKQVKDLNIRLKASKSATATEEEYDEAQPNAGFFKADYVFRLTEKNRQLTRQLEEQKLMTEALLSISPDVTPDVFSMAQEIEQLKKENGMLLGAINRCAKEEP